MSQIENLKDSEVCTHDYETAISCFSHRSVNANEESNARRADRKQFPKISQDLSTSLALQLLYLGVKIVWVRACNKPSFKTEETNIVLALDFNEHRIPWDIQLVSYYGCCDQTKRVSMAHKTNRWA